MGGAASVRYDIYRGTSPDHLERIARNVTGTSYPDAEVAIRITYHYNVRAINQVGEGPPSGVTTVQLLTIPGTPRGLVVIPGDTTASLTWSLPDDDGGSPITGYTILRGLFPEALQEVAQLGNVLGYTDANLTNGRTYYYTVRANNVLGAGEASATVSVTPLGAPGKVGLLTAKIVDDAVVLTWTAPGDSDRAPATGYIVYRGTSADALEVLVEVDPVLTYTDTTVEKGTTYHYVVVAKSDMGEGLRADAVTAKVAKKEDGPGPGALAVTVTLATAASLVSRRRMRG
jgi:fibronectin type 3 domain-containing protein